MTPTASVLLGVICTLLVGSWGWMASRLVRQLDATTRTLGATAEAIERLRADFKQHEAFHLLTGDGVGRMLSRSAKVTEEAG